MEAVGTLLHAAGVLLAASVLVDVTACDSASCGSAAMFQVYEPEVDASAIPLCTSAASATEATTLDGGSYAAFAGASPLSSAALAACRALCAQASEPSPCCVSVWEPNTVLCQPACVP